MPIEDNRSMCYYATWGELIVKKEELLRFALIGVLVRIEDEKKRLAKLDTKSKEFGMVQARIDKLIADYEDLSAEIAAL